MKKLALLAFFWIVGVSAFSQQKEFQWRVGFSGGYANYHGDLTPRVVSGYSDWKSIQHVLYYNPNYATKPSFKATLERQLSPSTGMYVHFGQYHFGMSDRYIERDGTLYLDNPDFARSLNFRNRTQDLGIGMVFRSDNDRLLSSEAFFAPYFTLGVGVMRFDVWGDLLDQNGQKYDNTVLDIIHDGRYETYLREVETELDGGFGRITFNTTLGLGFRFKITKKLELFAQSDFMYTFTDFLDDVSGRYREEYSSDFQAYASKPGFNTVDPERPYRGNPDGARDWIFYHGFGLKFNFGAAKKNYTGPRLSTGFYPPVPKPLPQRQPITLDPPTPSPIPSSIADGHQDHSLRIWEDMQRLDTLKYENQMLAWEHQIQRREAHITNGRVREKNLVQVQSQIERQYQNLLDDKNLTASEKEEFIRASDQNRFNVRYSLDSLRRKENELAQEIDSISALKNSHRLTPTVMVVYVDTIGIGRKNEIGRSTAVSENQLSTKDEQTTETSRFSEDSKVSRNSMNQIQTASSLEEQNRIQNLEAENRYLQSERDRLLSEYSKLDSKGKRKKEKRPKIKTKNSTDQVVVREQSSNEDETRRQRRRRLAAAGAVVGTVAILSDNENNEEQETNQRQEASSETTPTQEQSDAISLASMGLSKGTVVPLELPKPEVAQITENPTRTLSDNQPDRRRALPENYFQPIETIYFDSNQKVPDKKETDKLKELAEFVRTHEGYGLMLTGYTDNTGSLTYNLKLAEERMENVASTLETEYGIAKELIQYQSGGKVLRGGQKANNPKDRKVEVSLVLLEEEAD